MGAILRMSQSRLPSKSEAETILPVSETLNLFQGEKMPCLECVFSNYPDATTILTNCLRLLFSHAQPFSYCLCVFVQVEKSIIIIIIISTTLEKIYNALCSLQFSFTQHIFVEQLVCSRHISRH